VAPRVIGQIARLLVEDNNRVRKGGVLLQLDPISKQHLVCELLPEEWIYLFRQLPTIRVSESSKHLHTGPERNGVKDTSSHNSLTRA
jgi:Biotin-lipoyl like